MTPLPITAVALASALGHGTSAALKAMRHGQSGLRRNDFPDSDLDTWIGRVTGLEDAPLGGEFSHFDSRCSRLAQLGLQQDGFEAAVARATARHGAHRVAVYVGTSSSGILEAELAFRNRDPVSGALPAALRFRDTYNLYSVSSFVQQRLGLRGPCCTVSSACASSAKAFAAAQRSIAAGLCDAAVVGGVETLCFTTLQGFASLELLSSRPCRPFDPERNGISIGEAAAFALLDKDGRGGWGLSLLGCGESADAFHMSTPHPQGLGAARAMRAALDAAGLPPEGVDYLNLHGTGTRNNDAAENAAVAAVFSERLTCSATKGLTGHTLGAAGAVEAVLTLLALRDGFVPGTANTRHADPQFGIRLALATAPQALRNAMSNSFGFGGSNCSLVFGHA